MPADADTPTPVEEGVTPAEDDAPGMPPVDEENDEGRPRPVEDDERLSFVGTMSVPLHTRMPTVTLKLLLGQRRRAWLYRVMLTSTLELRGVPLSARAGRR